MATKVVQDMSDLCIQEIQTQTQNQKNHRKIVILGDSITHGGEGDYTWRYRLWQWCKQENLLSRADSQESEYLNPNTAVNPASKHKSKTSVSFVGPYTGVKGPDPPNIPHPAPLPGEEDPYNRPAVHIAWGYARDVDQDFTHGSRHFATWGYQAFQCKETIADVVRDWQPDLILSLLGFNDVGWWVSDADGTLDSIHQIIERTRAVKPDVDFAIGNIVNRTYMEGRQDLLDNTKKFNDTIPIKAKEWSKKHSRVVAVDVAKHYDCGPQYRDWAPAAYDGLHPSALGEFQIAKAFSEALLEDFGLGGKALEVPHDVPKRDLREPEDVVMESTPAGVTVTWPEVFGAAYEIRHREFSALSEDRDEADDVDDSWNVAQTHFPRFDIELPKGSQAEVEIRCTHGFEHGPWSRRCKCTCKDDSIPGPTEVQTHSISSGFAVAWTRIDTSIPIQRYEVLYKDDDRGDAFPSLQGSTTCHSEIRDLPEGDVIEWIMVRGWAFRKRGKWVEHARYEEALEEGEWIPSEWGHGRAVRVGKASASDDEHGNACAGLPRPQNLRVEEPGKGDDGTTVSLVWDYEDPTELSARVAGFLVYIRALTDTAHVAQTDGRVWRDAKADVFCIGGKWNYEFSVSAVNGAWESDRSAGVIPEQA